MYNDFCYIIENENGDVVVFDFIFFGVVVVIDCNGKYCFFYIGYLFGLELMFWGISIDVLLYIFLCDKKINIV